MPSGVKINSVVIDIHIQVATYFSEDVIKQIFTSTHTGLRCSSLSQTHFQARLICTHIQRAYSVPQ